MSSSNEILLRIRTIADMQDAAKAQAALRALHAEAAQPARGGFLAGISTGLRDMRAAFSGAGGGVQGTLDALATGAGGVALGLSAVATAALIAKKAVAEFAAAEENVAKLDAALAQNGLLTDANREKYQALAGELQQLTGIADDEWVGVLTRLTQFGSKPETIGIDIEAVKNLAGLMGGDVQTAANAYSRALQGNFEMFRRYGIEVADAGTQTEKMGQLQEQAAQRGGGQLEAVNQTLSGQYRSLKANTGDFFEALGRGISRTQLLQGGMGALSTAFEYWAGALGGTVPKVDGLKNSLAGAARTEAEAAAAATTLKEAQEGLKTSIEQTNQALERELKLMSAEVAAADAVGAAVLREAIAKINAGSMTPEEKKTAIAMASATTEKEKEQRQIEGKKKERDVLAKADNDAKAAQGKAEGAVVEAQGRLTAEQDFSKVRRRADEAERDYKEIVEETRRIFGDQVSPEQVEVEIGTTEALRKKAAETAAAKASAEAGFKERFGEAPMGVGKAGDVAKLAGANAKAQAERNAKEGPDRQVRIEALNTELGGLTQAQAANDRARRQEVRTVAVEGGANLPPLIADAPAPRAGGLQPPPVGPSTDSFTGTQLGRGQVDSEGRGDAERLGAEANRSAAALNGATAAIHSIADDATEFAAAVAEISQQYAQSLADATARMVNQRP